MTNKKPIQPDAIIFGLGAQFVTFCILIPGGVALMFAKGGFWVGLIVLIFQWHWLRSFISYNKRKNKEKEKKT